MFPCQLFVTHPAEPNLCVVSVRGFLKSQELTGEEQPLPLAEMFSSDCTAASSMQFPLCFLSFTFLSAAFRNFLDDGAEQGAGRMMMLWFPSPFFSFGADLHLSCSYHGVNVLLPGHVLNVTTAGVRVELEFVTPPSAGISPWTGCSGLGLPREVWIPIPGGVQGTQSSGLGTRWDQSQLGPDDPGALFQP